MAGDAGFDDVLGTRTPSPPPSVSDKPPCSERAWRASKGFLQRQQLPIMLVLAVLLGIAWPAPGVGVSVESSGVKPVSFTATIIIFFISGLQLTTDSLRKAITEWRAITWGLASIMFFTSAIGIALTGLALPDSNSFGAGLKVFYVGPTAISSGVVLVTQGHGNAALALLLTVSTNILGIFVLPYVLNWLADFSSTVDLDEQDLIIKLVLSVLAPLFCGKALTAICAPVRRFAAEYKSLLKYISMYSLIIIPWMNVSVAKDDGAFDKVTARLFFELLGWACAMHILFLVLNYIAVRVLQLNPPEQMAVVILGSQKTLPVALSVVSYLPETIADPGLMVVACIVAHIVQVLIDSVLVSRWVLPPPAPPGSAAPAEAPAAMVDLQLNAVVVTDPDAVPVQMEARPRLYSQV